MLIIVTGAIGSGKTTVCQKLIEILRNRGYVCSGFLTHKGADQNIIIEDVKSRKKMVLAGTCSAYSGPRTFKYSFNSQGIDFGIKAIIEDTGDILFVDEVGQLELRGEGFTNVLELIKSGNYKNCVLVIRSQLLSAFLSQLPSAPLIFETSTGNRSELPEAIASMLLEVLKNN